MSDTSTALLDRTARMYWLHARSPVHVGAGRGLGFIDLPIAREKVTDWPLVPGSAVKGVFADRHGADSKSRADKEIFRKAFGYVPAEDSAKDAALDNSGSLNFADARLVAFPVCSAYGTFAWCSCPLALERLRRDLEATDLKADLPQFPTLRDQQVHVPQEPTTALATSAGQRVFFKDLDFQAVPCQAATAWAAALASWAFASTESQWQDLFRQRFAVLSDDVFTFLAQTATQVDARVKIDGDTKTVEEGALWYEESLPPESILAGVVWCGPVYASRTKDTPDARRAADTEARNELLTKFCTDDCQLQIGGKATVGRGDVRLRFAPA